MQADVKFKGCNPPEKYITATEKTFLSLSKSTVNTSENISKCKRFKVLYDQNLKA